jgi:protein pelota
MKIDWQHVRPNGKGHAVIEIDHIEDFWTLATVIRPGDRIRAQIRRKIKTERTGTGKTESTFSLMIAKVTIQEIDFQAGIDEMQLRGTHVKDIEGGKAGTFQRVMLGVGRPFTLSKTIWKLVNATVAPVLLANGVANVCLICRNATRIVDHIEKAMPKIRKMGDAGKNQAARGKFFDAVANALVTKVPIPSMKCIIIASPGFIARDFFAFLDEHKNQLQITAAFQANRFIVATSTSAHLDALEQLLLMPEIAEHVKDLKAVTQARAWAEFQKAIVVFMKWSDRPQKSVFSFCGCHGRQNARFV